MLFILAPKIRGLILWTAQHFDAGTVDAAAILQDIRRLKVMLVYPNRR